VSRPTAGVRAKLSARVRVFDTGQGRKTDPVDAHSVAVAGLRSPGLRRVQIDDATVALRLLVDRRAGLGRTRTEVVNRIHRMLLELIPGGAKKFLTQGPASHEPAICCAPPPNRWASWPTPATTSPASSSTS
jgi:transposase